MNSVIDDLVRLQDHDAIIRDLEQQVADIPGRRAQIEASIQDAENLWKHFVQRLTDARLSLKASEDELLDAKNYLVKLENDRMQLKSNEEYKAMQAQIEHATANIRACEAKIEENRGKIPPAEEAAADAEAKYHQAKVGIDEEFARLDACLAELQRKLEEAKAQRGPLVAPLTKGAAASALLSTYERLRVKRWPAAVAVQDNVCSGCLMSIPASKTQTAHQMARRTADGSSAIAMSGKVVHVGSPFQVILCDFCGRIIF